MATIRTGDLDTHYTENGSGPAIVLIHAATLDVGSWRQHLDDLGRDHRVIAYDMRGHGKTANPGGVYDAATLADDLAAFVDALGLDRPVVCGLSLGGMVAQTFASRHPEKLSALIVAGAPVASEYTKADLFQAAVFPKIMIAPARLVGYERIKRGLVWIQKKMHGDEAAGGFSAADLPPMTTVDFARAVGAMTSFHQVDVDLSRIAVPTLVLFGENEPPFIRRHAGHLAQRVAGAQLRAVPDAGHASSLDQPELFCQYVRDFVASLRTRAVAPA